MNDIGADGISFTEALDRARHRWWVVPADRRAERLRVASKAAEDLLRRLSEAHSLLDAPELAGARSVLDELAAQVGWGLSVTRARFGLQEAEQVASDNRAISALSGGVAADAAFVLLQHGHSAAASEVVEREAKRFNSDWRLYFAGLATSAAGRSRGSTLKTNVFAARKLLTGWKRELNAFLDAMDQVPEAPRLVVEMLERLPKFLVEARARGQAVIQAAQERRQTTDAIERGRKLLKEGKLDEAGEQLLSAANDVVSSEDLEDVARAWIKAGEPEKALRLTERALALIDSPGLWAQQAIAQQALDRWELAEATLLGALEHHPGDVDVLTLQALLFAEHRPPEEALQHIELALHSGSAEPALLRAHAQVLDRLGRPQDALEVWETTAAASPKDPSVQLALAATLERLGRYGEAAAVCARAAHLAPSADSFQRLQALLETMLGAGDVNDVIRRLDDVEELHPPLSLRGLRAEALRSQGDLGAADSVATELLQQQPEDDVGAYLLATRGSTRTSLGRVGEGLADLNAALKLVPDYPFGSMWKIVALTCLDEYGSAQREMDRAFPVSNPPNGYESWAVSARGEMALDLWQLERGIQLLTAHGDKFELDTVGRLRFRLGDVDEAIDEMRRTTDQPDITSDLLSELGAALLLTGDIDGSAKSFLDRAVSVGEQGPPLYRFKSALAKLLLNDEQGALTQLAEVWSREAGRDERMLHCFVLLAAGEHKQARARIQELNQLLSSCPDDNRRQALGLEGLWRADLLAKLGKVGPPTTDELLSVIEQSTGASRSQHKKDVTEAPA